MGGRPYQFQIEDRRITVKYFRDQGMTPREIARKMKQRIEVIKRDLRAIHWEEKLAEESHRLRMEEVRLREVELAKKLIEDKERIEEAVEKIKEKMKSRPQPVSRGPKGKRERIRYRRLVVLELRYRGIKQNEIARMLRTPLRTIQRDCSHLNNRPFERYKLAESSLRNSFMGTTNEEMVEAVLDSPERIFELMDRGLKRSQGSRVQFKLKWVKGR